MIILCVCTILASDLVIIIADNLKTCVCNMPHVVVTSMVVTSDD